MEGNTNKIVQILITLVVGLCITVTGLFLEYKTNFFRNNISPLLLGDKDNTTPISNSYIVQTKDITISQANTGDPFNGEIVIALISASEYSNKVSAIISSPGFEELNIEKKVGQKVIYETFAEYEIQIMGVQDGTFSTPSTATFRITKRVNPELSGTQIALSTQLATNLLTPTPTPILIDQIQQITVARASVIDAFDGDLSITVLSASQYSNSVTAIISSPGFPELKIDSEYIGFRTEFLGNAKYEIQIMAATDGSFDTPSTATFRIIKFK